MRTIAGTFFFLYAFVANCYYNKPAFANTTKTGKQFIYSYSSEGVGYSDIQMLYNTDTGIKVRSFFFRTNLQTTHVNINCKIRETIIGSTDSLTSVCVEIHEPVVKIENNTLPVDVDGIAKEMALPIFVDMSVTGNIVSVKTDTAVSYLTAGIVKNILSNTQAVIFSRNNQGWQVTEENTVGWFKADYRLVNKSADSIEYQKANIGYEKIKSAKKGQRLIPENITVIVIDTSGIVQRINISETLVTLFGEDTIVVSGSSTEYKLISTGSISNTKLLALKQLGHSGKYLKSVALSAPISDEEINRMAYKNTLDADNFETLSEKLRLVTTHDKQYESELVLKFRALAWLSETDCSKMAALLKDAESESDVFRIISNALAAVKTSFSINELAGIIAKRKNEESVMIELLPVLATTTTPTTNAADIIKELAFSKSENTFITSTAQLTLGGMVKNLVNVDRKKADKLTDVIIENMKNNGDTLQQLFVYGNTGSYRLLPVISSYILNPSVSDEIRKAAVFATRWIDHKEVTSLLEKLVINKDTILSKAANETILFRNEYLNENF